MASPPAQPTVADAVRMMDALRTPSGLVPTGAPAPTTHQITAAETTSLIPGHDCVPAHEGSGERRKPQLTTAGHARTPPLPAEIIFHIGTHLAPCHQPSQGTTSLPCPHAAVLLSAPYSGVETTALLALASASRRFRNTLVPLIWHTLTIRTPQDLPRLAALLSGYDTISTRSLSPSRGDEGLRHPLPHIRSIIVAVPDRYTDLDQTYLLALLRAMDLSRTGQLEHLSWSAECAPSPALWPLLAPSLKALEVDGRMFFHGHSGMAGLRRLEVLKMTGYDSTLLPTGAVGVLSARANSKGEVGVSEVPKEASPVVELQSAPRRRAQHVYLDASPTDPLCEPDVVPVQTGTSRLRHLSLSSSKTSLLHQPGLISRGCFVGLTCLDIYAVTPEPPLASAILSAGATLTHLRLVLDISGAFAHFDSLWSTLTSHLPQLRVLEVDPMPQQNTAPSFGAFVESCARLRRINGRSVDSFPPCFGDFDPTHPSGALPF